ncbi:hypothetical protein DPMN_119560 [Dreissena polymorpha]|uniref:Uncharacterized protein n=1 Tax=Dreissena polymorpha TaxID=45954 RepID=A0A9D4GIZ1_DREPO|nr:hypothetical protein DPMN_119560 [Dreissena polymorpha]
MRVSEVIKNPRYYAIGWGRIADLHNAVIERNSYSKKQEAAKNEQRGNILTERPPICMYIVNYAMSYYRTITVQLTQNQQIPRSAEFDDINCSRSRLGIDHLVAESPCLFAETRRGTPRHDAEEILMEPHISQTREVSYANDDDGGDENDDDDHDAAAAPPPPPMLLLLMMMMMLIMFNIMTAFEHRYGCCTGSHL